ncbi:serine hydrolase [Actinomadura parmotrematis]|uniref:Serine hydrolase n=1 Tax=Actinomadura parmotrematis TaxID=2864039 RepID=A0ABS7FVL6_9ACTN|nr:serine hydrolase [Actinomadura parmotrematis]MBW8484225.1 serine hydrolase [Actinomadura parmotrematis]
MRISAALLDRRTGRALAFGDGGPFAAASIVKVNIVAALLRRGHPLTAEERTLCAAAIRTSDNDATTALWTRLGGAPGLAAANRALGLRSTVPHPAWGRTLTTAADQIRLLDPLTRPGNAFLLDLMADVHPDQAWGVSAVARPGESVALKNGWTPRDADAGAWTVHSIGRLTGPDRDLLIAVLSGGHPSLPDGITAVERAAARAAARSAVSVRRPGGRPAR